MYRARNRRARARIAPTVAIESSSSTSGAPASRVCALPIRAQSGSDTVADRSRVESDLAEERHQPGQELVVRHLQGHEQHRPAQLDGHMGGDPQGEGALADGRAGAHDRQRARLEAAGQDVQVAQPGTDARDPAAAVDAGLETLDPPRKELVGLGHGRRVLGERQPVQTLLGLIESALGGARLAVVAELGDVAGGVDESAQQR